jgi:hypothetical protein
LKINSNSATITGMQPDYQNTPGQPYNAMPPQQPYGQQPAKRHFNTLIIPLILVIVFLLLALVFAFWAMGERSDYKNNVDQKVASALEDAVKEAEANKEKEFVEREKSPFRTYEGPSDFGGIKIKYPKTWSAYIEEERSGSSPINGYFYPNFVPNTQSDTPFALRIELLESDYAQELDSYETASENGEVKVSPLKAVNVPKIVGAKIIGELDRDKRGIVAMFPLRDKTLVLTTENMDFAKDFNDIILKYLTFNP